MYANWATPKRLFDLKAQAQDGCPVDRERGSTRNLIFGNYIKLKGLIYGVKWKEKERLMNSES